MFFNKLVKLTFHLICVCCLGFFPTSSFGNTISQHEYAIFSEAKRHLENQNYASAAKSLESYFKSGGKKNVYGYELYGVILLNGNQPSKAVEILKKGTEFYPDNATLFQNLGIAYSKINQPASAAKACHTAYELSKNKDPNLAFTAAYYYVQAKQYVSAINLLNLIINREDVKITWIQLLAQAHIHRGHFKSATSVLEKGLNTFQSSHALWRLLGFCHYRNKQLEKAAGAYEIAYKLSKPSTKEIQNLAALYCAINAPYSGQKLLSDTKSNLQLLDSMAILFAKMGDLENAEKKAEQALKLKSSVDRQFRLAQILLRNKKYAKASIYLNNIANSNSKDKEQALWMLVNSAWVRGQWKEVDFELQRIISLQGNSAKSAEQLAGTIAQFLEPVE